MSATTKLQIVGPLLGFVDESDDLERAVGDAIGGDRRGARDHQFARAVYASRASALRVETELFDGFFDAVNRIAVRRGRQTRG